MGLSTKKRQFSFEQVIFETLLVSTGYSAKVEERFNPVFDQNLVPFTKISKMLKRSSHDELILSEEVFYGGCNGIVKHLRRI